MKGNLPPLMGGTGIADRMTNNPPASMEDFMQRFVTLGQAAKINSLTEGVDRLITGETLLIVEGFNVALSLSTKKWEHRQPAEQDTEAVVRLKRIDTDDVIDRGYIEEFIEDQPFTPFPQIQPTERPDTAAANLLEGRFAILVDGSPFVLDRAWI